jgi:hypothetical protein
MNPRVPVCTVDTWRIRPGTEAHFLGHCGALNPSLLALYRDLEEPGLFWSPAKWKSLEELNEWRTSAPFRAAVRALEEDLLDHQTHVMTEVPGFPPQASRDETPHTTR